MALTDRLAHAPKGRGHYCTVGKLLVELASTPPGREGPEFQALVRALADPEFPGTAIHKVLQEEGWYFVRSRHVQDHRRGGCTTATCPDPNTGVKP